MGEKRRRILPGEGPPRGLIGGVECGGEPKPGGTLTSGGRKFGYIDGWIDWEE